MTDNLAAMFAPLTAEEKAVIHSNDNNAGMAEEILRSIPPNAPVPDFSLRGYTVDTVSEYQNLDGTPANFVVRYYKFDQNGNVILNDKGKAEKTFRPWSLARAADGSLKWVSKGMNAPRQVHNVVAVMKADKVAVAEGEVCAAKLTVFTSKWIPTTWQGGAGAVNHTDWSPLRGKTVIGFPDMDEPGRKAMKEVAERCLEAGAARFGIVRIEQIATWTLKETASLSTGTVLSRRVSTSLTSSPKASPGTCWWGISARRTSSTGSSRRRTLASPTATPLRMAAFAVS